jgi:hypothetical protein
MPELLLVDDNWWYVYDDHQNQIGAIWINSDGLIEAESNTGMSWEGYTTLEEAANHLLDERG